MFTGSELVRAHSNFRAECSSIRAPHARPPPAGTRGAPPCTDNGHSPWCAPCTGIMCRPRRHSEASPRPSIDLPRPSPSRRS